MIAADTSSLSAFFKGEEGPDVDAVTVALAGRSICVPPAVVTELLSDPLTQAAMLESVADFPLLAVLEGYWQRAGETRRLLKSKGLKAKIADALIAQSCVAV